MIEGRGHHMLRQGRQGAGLSAAALTNLSRRTHRSVVTPKIPASGCQGPSSLRSLSPIQISMIAIAWTAAGVAAALMAAGGFLVARRDDPLEVGSVSASWIAEQHRATNEPYT